MVYQPDFGVALIGFIADERVSGGGRAGAEQERTRRRPDQRPPGLRRRPAGRQRQTSRCGRERAAAPRRLHLDRSDLARPSCSSTALPPSAWAETCRRASPPTIRTTGRCSLPMARSSSGSCATATRSRSTRRRSRVRAGAGRRLSRLHRQGRIDAGSRPAAAARRSSRRSVPTRSNRGVRWSRAAPPRIRRSRTPRRSDTTRSTTSTPSATKRWLRRLNANPNLNPDIAGYDNLGAYGQWHDVAGYGKSWVPQQSPNWAPYSNGSWTWEGGYGWTWVAPSRGAGRPIITAAGFMPTATAGRGILRPTPAIPHGRPRSSASSDSAWRRRRRLWRRSASAIRTSAGIRWRPTRRSIRGIRAGLGRATVGAGPVGAGAATATAAAEPASSTSPTSRISYRYFPHGGVHGTLGRQLPARNDLGQHLRGELSTTSADASG